MLFPPGGRFFKPSKKILVALIASCEKEKKGKMDYRGYAAERPSILYHEYIKFILNLVKYRSISDWLSLTGLMLSAKRTKQINQFLSGLFRYQIRKKSF